MLLIVLIIVPFKEISKVSVNELEYFVIGILIGYPIVKFPINPKTLALGIVAGAIVTLALPDFNA